MSATFTHQARCTVTGYVAGTYQSADRAQETCDEMNARLPLHRFVVVDTTAPTTRANILPSSQNLNNVHEIRETKLNSLV